MRLICPNCGAQYDVADDAIPVEGRDVQCSDCGHTWFESPDAPSATAEDDAGDSAPAPAHAPRPAPPPTPPAPPTPTPPVAPPVAVRQQLDPSIADILRQEAAREEAVRRAEAQAMPEQQDELPLTAPDRTRRRTPDTGTPADRDGAAAPVVPAAVGIAAVGPAAATPAPATPAPVTPATTGTGNRREMFPDIEEINSTLRSSADREALPLTSAALAERDRKSGRIGFFGTLAVMAVLLLIYANADDIAAAVPALAAPLDGYATGVDQVRIRLDTWVQGLLNETEGTR